MHVFQDKHMEKIEDSSKKIVSALYQSRKGKLGKVQDFIGLQSNLDMDKIGLTNKLRKLEKKGVVIFDSEKGLVVLSQEADMWIKGSTGFILPGRQVRAKRVKAITPAPKRQRATRGKITKPVVNPVVFLTKNGLAKSISRLRDASSKMVHCIFNQEKSMDLETFKSKMSLSKSSFNNKLFRLQQKGILKLDAEKKNVILVRAVETCLHIQQVNPTPPRSSTKVLVTTPAKPRKTKQAKASAVVKATTQVAKTKFDGKTVKRLVDQYPYARRGKKSVQTFELLQSPMAYQDFIAQGGDYYVLQTGIKKGYYELIAN